MKPFLIVALIVLILPVGVLATVSVENNVSVSANSGGNSASGTNGSSGRTLTTGDASARATVQTTVGGQNFEDIEIEVETEGEPVVVERRVATSSGNVKVETSVRVSADSSGSSTTVLRHQVFGKTPGEEDISDEWFDDELEAIEEISDELDENLDELENEVERLEDRPLVVRLVRKLLNFVFSIFGL